MSEIDRNRQPCPKCNGCGRMSMSDMDGGFFEAYWGQAMRFLKEMKRLIDAETIRIDVNHGRSPVEIATLRGMDASDVRVWALQNMDLIWSPITDRWLPRAGDNEPATQRLEEFACRQNLLADVHPSSQNHKISNDKPSQTEINLALTKQAVIEDLRRREQKGIETYGTTLQTHNGRNALQDAYEEVLDLAQYLKQHLMEQDTAS